MEPNPLPPPTPKTPTAPGAVWSLVLGILSLTCFSALAGIPAVICGHIAHSRIKRSPNELSGAGLALAGMITGYISIALAVFVIPILLALALPAFSKARSSALQNACINNLRQIDGAVQTWALEKKVMDDAKVTWDDIMPYLKTRLVCPAGGTYSITAASSKPTCSVPGHELP